MSFKIKQNFFNISGYTYLIVIGGYNYKLGGYLNSVEVIDLKNPTNTCNMIADYTFKHAGMTVGIIGGLIKSCGSSYDTNDCYDYNPATNSWITSASLIKERTKPRSSFIDGVWLISGSNDPDTDSTTERWTGRGFELGPSLPIGMYAPCQLTINSTHVFFADTFETGNAFLLDWYEQ